LHRSISVEFAVLAVDAPPAGSTGAAHDKAAHRDCFAASPARQVPQRVAVELDISSASPSKLDAGQHQDGVDESSAAAFGA